MDFILITRGVDRLQAVLPRGWEDGYEDVTICCTIENQDNADYRLPIYQSAPIKHKVIICESLLELIGLRFYNISSWIEQVVVGGESGIDARLCNFDCIMKLHHLCVEEKVMF